jgi:hypothetical protein
MPLHSEISSQYGYTADTVKPIAKKKVPPKAGVQVLIYVNL